MRRPHREAGALPSGGLTPLLDTLFLLLFALLALSDARREAHEPVRIELPRVEPGESEVVVPAEPLVLGIGAEGEVQLGDTPVPTRAALDDALEEALGGRSAADVAVEIRADRRTQHGVAITLLQHLRLRGFRSVQLLATGYDELPEGGGGWR